MSNLYSVGQRRDDPVVDRCTEAGIAYLPFFPLAMGKVGRETVVSAVAERLGTTPTHGGAGLAAAALAGHAADPGTSKVAHLEENVSATELTLTADDLAELDGTVA